MATYSFSDPNCQQQPLPPGEDVPSSSTYLVDMLRKMTDAPLLGTEFVVEILAPDENVSGTMSSFYCILCDRGGSSFTDVVGIVSDLMSAQHRLKYIERYFPIAFEKFDVVPNRNVWERSTFDFLEGVAMAIEKKFGRINPTAVVSNKSEFFKQKDILSKTINEARHFRQCDELNFLKLTDPFGAYLRHIPKYELKLHRKPSFETLSKSNDSNGFSKNKRMADEKDDCEVVIDVVMDDDVIIEEPEKVRHENVDEYKGGDFRDLRTKLQENRGHEHRRRHYDDNRNSPGRYSREIHYSRRERSRARSRDRARSYHRSQISPVRSSRRRVSPYTRAYDNWRRYLRAEGDMIESLCRKRDIYQNRPEDHPKYNSEWFRFWENRYKELQYAGFDADNYDYKSEWIPHWTRCAAEMFKIEKADKIKQLLFDFNLDQRREPRREDFRRVTLSPTPPRDNEYEDREERYGSISKKRRTEQLSPDRRLSPPPRSEDTVSPVVFCSLLACLRKLLALEDFLGSLGPHLTALMNKTLILENKQAGAGNVLLMEPDVACVLDLVKEKMSGQLDVGLVSSSKRGAVKKALESLHAVLKLATTKRPSEPPKINDNFVNAKPSFDKTRYKLMVAEEISKILVAKGKANVCEEELCRIIHAVIYKTELDDGSLPDPYAPPPPTSLASYNDLDDLTMEELQSLLANFKNISKTEQMELIRYMRKLEMSDPLKVQQLRANQSMVLSPNQTRPSFDGNEHSSL